ncbi:long-chain-acyl-CoA synthetase family protein [Onchocerca flexuosa]|uniref:Very long-chain fatty acid transport protein n=1 Tax=Onchocerca flexuosa TaxID=387005 RepID=A0A238BJT9_9BILA|nr:long-chain-acyl-CoA synthetase family protein [Onchocerca flexuosa]
MFDFILSFGELTFWSSLLYILSLYIFFAFFAYLIFKCLTSHYFYQFHSTIGRDFCGLVLLIRVKWDIWIHMKMNEPLHQIFLRNVKNYRDKEALIEVDTGRRLTFHEMNQLCNQYANYFQSQGYKNGDVIALFLQNCADFPAIWLGLSKIGVVTSWVNINLRAEPLAYSITISKSTSIITSNELFPALEDMFLSGKLERMKVYIIDDIGNKKNGILSLATKIPLISSEEPVVNEKPTFRSVLCYIFTSGTTGNPKPALIKHYRYYWMAIGVAKSFGIFTTDRLYVMMPAYHSAGGMLGIGQTVLQGSTCVIRKKFSASYFWKDCVKYNCNVTQYIGEICRYLLMQKEIVEAKEHKIRLMFGNGLRAEIWSEFVNRFGIQKIGEFYGSTEGNSSIVNIDNHIGACGFIPVHPFVKYLYPVRLLKINDDTGELIRTKDGFCVACKPGETGEIVAVIKKNQPLLNFDGYLDEKDTGKKIIRNVLCKGDAVFTSGDIMHWDDLGYLYFKDRKGDTYRWKGENVSTTEVEGILQLLKCVNDVVVYGVKIPNREGRAGMAAIVLERDEFLEDVIHKIAEHFKKSLPSYAIPIFLRFCKNFERTGTYKLKKMRLQKEGYDLSDFNNQIYIWDSSIKSYKIFDEKLRRHLNDGTYMGI